MTPLPQKSVRHFREERAPLVRIEGGVVCAKIPLVDFFESLGLLFRGKTVRYGLLWTRKLSGKVGLSLLQAFPYEGKFLSKFS